MPPSGNTWLNNEDDDIDEIGPLAMSVIQMHVDSIPMTMHDQMFNPPYPAVFSTPGLDRDYNFPGQRPFVLNLPQPRQPVSIDLQSPPLAARSPRQPRAQARRFNLQSHPSTLTNSISASDYRQNQNSPELEPYTYHHSFLVSTSATPRYHSNSSNGIPGEGYFEQTRSVPLCVEDLQLPTVESFKRGFPPFLVRPHPLFQFNQYQSSVYDIKFMIPSMLTHLDQIQNQIINAMRKGYCMHNARSAVTRNLIKIQNDILKIRLSINNSSEPVENTQFQFTSLVSLDSDELLENRETFIDNQFPIEELPIFIQIRLNLCNTALRQLNLHLRRFIRRSGCMDLEEEKSLLQSVLRRLRTANYIHQEYLNFASYMSYQTQLNNPEVPPTVNPEMTVFSMSDEDDNLNRPVPEGQAIFNDLETEEDQNRLSESNFVPIAISNVQNINSSVETIRVSNDQADSQPVGTTSVGNEQTQPTNQQSTVENTTEDANRPERGPTLEETLAPRNNSNVWLQIRRSQRDENAEIAGNISVVNTRPSSDSEFNIDLSVPVSNEQQTDTSETGPQNDVAASSSATPSSHMQESSGELWQRMRNQARQETENNDNPPGITFSASRRRARFPRAVGSPLSNSEGLYSAPLTAYDLNSFNASTRWISRFGVTGRPELVPTFGPTRASFLNHLLDVPTETQNEQNQTSTGFMRSNQLPYLSILLPLPNPPRIPYVSRVALQQYRDIHNRSTALLSSWAQGYLFPNPATRGAPPTPLDQPSEAMQQRQARLLANIRRHQSRLARLRQRPTPINSEDHIIPPIPRVANDPTMIVGPENGLQSDINGPRAIPINSQTFTNYNSSWRALGSQSQNYDNLDVLLTGLHQNGPDLAIDNEISNTLLEIPEQSDHNTNNATSTINNIIAIIKKDIIRVFDVNSTYDKDCAYFDDLHTGDDTGAFNTMFGEKIYPFCNYMLHQASIGHCNSSLCIFKGAESLPRTSTDDEGVLPDNQKSNVHTAGFNLYERHWARLEFEYILSDKHVDWCLDASAAVLKESSTYQNTLAFRSFKNGEKDSSCVWLRPGVSFSIYCDRIENQVHNTHTTGNGLTLDTETNNIQQTDTRFESANAFGETNPNQLPFIRLHVHKDEKSPFFEILFKEGEHYYAKIGGKLFVGQPVVSLNSRYLGLGGRSWIIWTAMEVPTELEPSQSNNQLVELGLSKHQSHYVGPLANQVYWMRDRVRILRQLSDFSSLNSNTNDSSRPKGGELSSQDEVPIFFKYPSSLNFASHTYNMMQKHIQSQINKGRMRHARHMVSIEIEKQKRERSNDTGNNDSHIQNMPGVTQEPTLSLQKETLDENQHNCYCNDLLKQTVEQSTEIILEALKSTKEGEIESSLGYSVCGSPFAGTIITGIRYRDGDVFFAESVFQSYKISQVIVKACTEEQLRAPFNFSRSKWKQLHSIFVNKRAISDSDLEWLIDQDLVAPFTTGTVKRLKPGENTWRGAVPNRVML